MRIFLAILLVVALASAASASVHRRAPQVPDDARGTLQLGASDTLEVDTAEIALTAGHRYLYGSLRLVFSTQHEDLADRSITFSVPNGTEVYTLAVTIADQRLEAVMASATGARAAYRDTVERQTDPALLEWVRADARRTTLRLHVFPVTPGSPATVELRLSFPRAPSIAIDPGPHRVGFARIAIDGGSTEEVAADARVALDVPHDVATIIVRGRQPSFVRKGRSLVATPFVFQDRCGDADLCQQTAYQRDPTDGTIQWRHEMRTRAEGPRVRSQRVRQLARLLP
ncbi:MAG: VIT domain-containing protein [Kofleriaceae bacterium]